MSSSARFLYSSSCSGGSSFHLRPIILARDSNPILPCGTRFRFLPAAALPSFSPSSPFSPSPSGSSPSSLSSSLSPEAPSFLSWSSSSSSPSSFLTLSSFSLLSFFSSTSSFSAPSSSPSSFLIFLSFFSSSGIPERIRALSSLKKMLYALRGRLGLFLGWRKNYCRYKCTHLC